MSDALVPDQMNRALATQHLAAPAQNPFLQGPFAPVDKETTTSTL
jgi:hypothetical protein